MKYGKPCYKENVISYTKVRYYDFHSFQGFPKDFVRRGDAFFFFLSGVEPEKLKETGTWETSGRYYKRHLTGDLADKMCIFYEKKHPYGEKVTPNTSQYDQWIFINILSDPFHTEVSVK